MAEETVWRGGVSQWKNFGFFLLQGLVALAILIAFVLLERRASPEVRNMGPYILILLAVPIFIAAARYLQTKCTIYELTTERLKTTEGVFSKVTARVLPDKGHRDTPTVSVSPLRNRKHPA